MGASQGIAGGYVPECKCLSQTEDATEKEFPPVSEPAVVFDPMVIGASTAAVSSAHGNGVSTLIDDVMYGCATSCHPSAPGGGRGTKSNQLLLVASEKGDVEGILNALAEGAKVNTRRAHIMVVAATDAAEAVQAANSNNAPRGVGMTALMRAAYNSHVEAVSVLLEFKASPMYQDEDGLTALHFAAMAGSKDCCRLLKAAGGKCDEVDDSGRLPRDVVAEDAISTREDVAAWNKLLASGDHKK
mmetsp:Transcript_35273/g.64524  ORF Transcript_35273/g.64524 Transcript_35273/m.64524 type:complete len:244 (-) Transcript_35273:88-819(-)